MEHPAFLVAGLAYGDEGKGATVDAIVRHTGADLVIRYNGGAQCAHNVVTPDHRHHTFAQFGSGTFVPEVRTYLSRFVLINPVSMLMESEDLHKVGIDDAFRRTTIDERAIVITPFQRALNRLQEISRGDGRHGSTGMGIGIAREDSIKFPNEALRVGDLPSQDVAEDKLEYSRKYCLERAAALHLPKYSPAIQREFGCLGDPATIDWYLGMYDKWCRIAHIDSAPPSDYKGLVFEGAQGMLLDEFYGFQPNTTWTDITYNNAYTILKEMEYKGVSHKIGVLRTYHTRHGAGPFPSENAELEKILGGFELHNKPEEYTGKLRIGSFDISLAVYANVSIGGVDSLALNHLDAADAAGHVVVKAIHGGTENHGVAYFISELQYLTKAPVSIFGYGPSFNERKFGPGMEVMNSCPN